MSRFTLAITLFGITLLSAGVLWITDVHGELEHEGVLQPFDNTSASVPLATPPLSPKADYSRYVDPVRGFSFDYPATLALSETETGEYHLILGGSADGETRLLIVAYPYVLDEPLTEENIRAQPDAADISSPIERTVLSSGATGFLFRRADNPLGATRDALFVHGGMVYQISVEEGFAAYFDRILDSWHFASSTTL